VTRFVPDDLQRIAATDDLHISPFRADGTTYGTPTWIWSVVVDDELYVRAYNGTRSSWYRAATTQRAGRVTAAGTSFEVTFAPAPADGDLANAIDAAYHSKYDPGPYVDHMVGRGSRQATIRIRPRASGRATRDDSVHEESTGAR
jgi:hypothetical protein